MSHQAPPPPAPPPPTWSPMPREVGPVPYPFLHRTGKPGWWRPILGILTVLVATLVVAPIALQVPIVVWFLATGRDVEDGVARLVDFDNPTPGGLAYLNIVLA